MNNMYNGFKVAEYEQPVRTVAADITQYAEYCVSIIISLINKNNKSTPFTLIPTGVIIFAGSEELSIELAKVFSKSREHLSLRNILIDDPATAYEHEGSVAIADLIQSDINIQSLSYENLTDSDTYENDLIILGSTYAGVEYSDYNTHSHNLLVKCEDIDVKGKDKFLYSFVDFYRASNSFCNNGMYTILTIK